jgi:uncharacterized membrane protein YkvA (DUF1232 family)
LKKIKLFFSQLTDFLRNLTADERIPARDKQVLLALFALVVSPIDLIPDWIPIIGLMDDLVMVAIILDYFFEVLDQDIVLSHYPWGMKSYAWLRRSSRLISFLTPAFIKDKIWKFKPDTYKT